MMKKIILTILALVMALAAEAQLVDPVHFTSELKTGKGAEAEIVFHATIDDGWHVYSTDIGKSGPIEATFHVVKLDQNIRSIAIWSMARAARRVVCHRRRWS